VVWPEKVRVNEVRPEPALGDGLHLLGDVPLYGPPSLVEVTRPMCVPDLITSPAGEQVTVERRCRASRALSMLGSHRRSPVS
jgi:hypothetical protein